MAQPVTLSGDEEDAPVSRTCGNCGLDMAHLRTLPRTAKFPEQRYFRCAECRVIEKDEV
jgi:DNA-directed RNA polymerase subunit M/transcription elongation factor TFIIS